jgi:DNA-binding Xre family transcriptional regulator
MKGNLRLAAANRGIWKASDLQRSLADHGLVISAGKMSGLWSGQPASVKLDDLDVICAVLDCQIGDLLIPETQHVTLLDDQTRPAEATGTGGLAVVPRRRRRPHPAAAVSRSPRDSTKPAASCVACFAWGVLPGRRCRACFSFKTNHAEGECVGCRLTVPVKKGYCRLCWHQAAMESRGITRTAEPYLENIRFQQLFLADLQYPRQFDVRPGKAGRKALRIKPEPGPPPTPSGWVQTPLFPQDTRDFTGFDRFRHSDPANVHLIKARRQLKLIAEGRGWPEELIDDVDHALAVVLSSHAETDTVRYSELIPALRQRGLRVGRVAEVLDAAGLLNDDRIPAFETWMQRKLTDVAPAIATDVQTWLQKLHDGGPRSRPRNPGTVWHYLNEILLILVDWTTRFDHLREVTADDVQTAVAGLHGHQRHITCVVLRSLFGHCKQTGTIFQNRPPGSRPADSSTTSSCRCTPARSTQPSPPPPIRPSAWPSPWPQSTPPAPRLSVTCNSTPSTWETDD